MFESIKELRIKRGLTQSQLAIKAGITQANLSQIENKERKVKMEVLEEIAKALDVELEELTLGQLAEFLDIKVEDRPAWFSKLNMIFSEAETEAEKEKGRAVKDFGNRDSFGRKKATREKEKGRAVKEKEENDRDSFGRKKSLDKHTRDQLGYRKEKEDDK